MAGGWGGRRINSGRPAGQTVAGRETRAIARAALADIIGSDQDPLLVAIGIATDTSNPATLRLEAAAVACRYVHPTLSAAAIHHTSKPADGGAAVQVLLDRLTALAPPPTPTIEATVHREPEPATEAK